MASLCDTLIVRHLPTDLSSDDCEDLLKHFGALKVRHMGSNGQMKNSAFAKFDSVESAKQALQRLHQLDVLGSKLVVAYSSNSFKDKHPSDLDNVKTKHSVSESQNELKAPPPPNYIERLEEKKLEISQDFNSVSSKWDAKYPINPKLRYAYPAPTICILTNIANALATVPRFYVQVLHLMNKMNLPAPFGLPTPTPPLPLGSTTSSAGPPLPSQVSEERPPEPDILEEEDMAFSSAEESELESEEESKEKPVDKITTAAKRKRERKILTESEIASKRLKLQLKMHTQLQAVPLERTAQLPSDVFESVESSTAARKIELKLPTEDSTKENVDLDVNTETVVVSDSVEVGGFGIIEPEQKLQTNPEEENNSDDDGETEFISSRELRRERVSHSEMQKLSVFKNYDAGEPSSRLYIKNLAKQVTEKDLHRIFGRYVNWEDETEKASFYKQLMTSGRMKGQAFVTLPTEEKTKQALRDTNGLMLYGKPIVVSFARSAKAGAASAAK